MKVQVAASERVENRDRPQMPWPLVQPEPRTVPTPTMRPAGNCRERAAVEESDRGSVKEKQSGQGRADQHADNENQPPTEFGVEV